MTAIVPAVLAATPEEYKSQLEKVSTFTSRIHVDVSDGVFAPTPTLSANQLWWPQTWQVDVHAMVARPSEYLPVLLGLRPSMVLFHAEVEENLIPLFQHMKQIGVKAGLAIMRSTVPADVSALIAEADHVMIFSGDLGKYGGTANMLQLEKVRLIRTINPGVEIGWDGGVAIENAFGLMQGGVDVLTVGGAIQRADNPKAVYDLLTKEVSKQGAI